MPQLDFDGANSKVSADKIQGQSGTTVTVPTGHKIAGTDANSITINGVNAVAVAPSTSGNVLTSTGSAWASSAAAGGAWAVKSSGTATDVTSFTVTGLSKTTKFFISSLVYGSTYKSLSAQLSSDNGTTWLTGANDYRGTRIYWHGSTDGSGTHSSDEFRIIPNGTGAYAGYSSCAEIILYDPADSANRTQLCVNASQSMNNANVQALHLISMHYETISAHNAIKFYPDGGNMTFNYTVIELN